MFYRENGQFRTTYRADQQIFPISQGRWAIFALLVVAIVGVPLLADEYMLRAIFIPFLILSLAALGVNILVGYCGQISLGSGAFMAVGAYAAYNMYVRIDGMPVILALLTGGFFATLVGILFGIPSLRVKGLYLALATLAAQFFLRLGVFARELVHQQQHLGFGSCRRIQCRRLADYLAREPVFVLSGICVGIRRAGQKPRARCHRTRVDGDSRHGRGCRGDRHPADVCQAQCLRRQFIHCGRRWRAVGLCPPRRLGASSVFDRSILSNALHGHHWWLGLYHGELFWCGLYRRAAHFSESIFASFGCAFWPHCVYRFSLPCRIDGLWRLDRLVFDRRAARPGETVERG